MQVKWLKILLLVLFIGIMPSAATAQKIIEYVAGMGSRDPNNADVWILFQQVRAHHEGMTLYTDSATFDTRRNSFTAYGNVVIKMTDTTTLYGDYAFYDGSERIADVMGDTVLLVDGATELRTDMLTYDRNSTTASYYTWGHTIHNHSTLDSRKGYYNSNSRDLFLYHDVVLVDSNSRLLTDSLQYNTRTEEAAFMSATNIYSDSASIYSERGFYNTRTHLARSYKASRVANREKRLFCDTLFFNDSTEYGEAYGHVVIIDTINHLACYGGMGITNQGQRFSFVTDSALVVQVDNGDSLFLHADSLWIFNNADKELEAAKAYNGVRLYRNDVQGVCDSLYYNAADSLLTLYHNPIVWYEGYQCSADTIMVLMDSAGVRLIQMKKNMFVIEEVDAMRHSQVKGTNANVYCQGGEPLYADILGSAQMVYYVLDEEEVTGSDAALHATRRSLLGVNVGVGSDMRIYFKDREPSRVVTKGSPDMKMYPPLALPDDQRFLPGYHWQSALRPRSRHEVFAPSAAKLGVGVNLSVPY